MGTAAVGTDQVPLVVIDECCRRVVGQDCPTTWQLAISYSVAFTLPLSALRWIEEIRLASTTEHAVFRASEPLVPRATGRLGSDGRVTVSRIVDPILLTARRPAREDRVFVTDAALKELQVSVEVQPYRLSASATAAVAEADT